MSNRKIYLVAFYFMRPKNQRVRTNVPGWIKDQNNITWDEQIAITTKLKNNDLTTAKIILNLTDKSVMINGWNGNKDFDELFDHFYKNYKKDIHPVVERLGYFAAPPAADLDVINPSALPIQTVNTAALLNTEEAKDESKTATINTV